MLQVGGWLPVMCTGKRPLKNERRVGLHQRLCARSFSEPRGIRQPGTELLHVLRVVSVEHDARLCEAAEVLGHEHGLVVHLRVREAQTAQATGGTTG